MYPNSIRFTAGQFARLHHINKRTLHYYDNIGLFSPAIKGDQGYRYYTYEQSPQLENILALRELDMSIGEIREYEDHPSADAFLKLSCGKIKDIDETIRHLKKLKAVLKERQEMLLLCQNMTDGQIRIIQCGEEVLFLTPLLFGEPQAEGIVMDALLTHLKNARDLNGHLSSCGSYLSIHKIRQSNFEVYDGLFTHLHNPKSIPAYMGGSFPGLHVKTAGTYLQGICVGSWEKIPALYKRMLHFAKDMDLEPYEYAYERGLNEIAISGMEEYVTEILIPVR